MAKIDLTSLVPSTSASSSTPGTLVPTIDFPTLISLGLAPGYTHFDKTGINNVVPASTFILLSNVTSAAFPVNFPTVAQQMQIISDSANDTAAGTGAHQIKLTYLRTPALGFAKNVEYITTNGLNPVLTANSDIYRVEMIEVSSVGSNLFSVGNVSLQSVGGATTFERIDAGGNFGQSCVHFVPGGYQSILFSLTKGASTAAGVIFVARKSIQFQGTNVAAHGIDRLEMGNFAVHYTLTPPEVIQNPNNLEMYFAIFVKGRASNQDATGTISFADSLI